MAWSRFAFDMVRVFKRLINRSYHLHESSGPNALDRNHTRQDSGPHRGELSPVASAFAEVKLKDIVFDIHTSLRVRVVVDPLDAIRTQASSFNILVTFLSLAHLKGGWRIQIQLALSNPTKNPYTRLAGGPPGTKVLALIACAAGLFSLSLKPPIGLAISAIG
ncbi:hypothetical protein FRC05_008018 [Tulasnella sp. 425]|nr:hypothetical protein FRC05_008018 [Tulasnella sp. 425]